MWSPIEALKDTLVVVFLALLLHSQKSLPCVPSATYGEPTPTTKPNITLALSQR
jgi:hypothetical protein